jgi:hypothetical protein
MDTDRSDVGTRREPDVVVAASPVVVSRPTPGQDGRAGSLADAVGPGDPPQPPRRGLAVLLVAGLVLVVGLTLALAIWIGGDSDVEATPAAGAAAPAPTELGMSVDPLDTVVAGEPATLTVRWADNDGVFGGTSEEWGDGVGTSSLSESRCEDVAVPAGPAAGTYDLTHTWSEPGTYAVVLGVTTYTCVDGSATEEQVTTPVTVEVLPAD